MAIILEINIKLRYIFILVSNVPKLNLDTIDCLQFNKPIYFVARDSQLVGLDKFLVKDKVIKNQFGNNTIGIYKLNINCKGKVFKLNLIWSVPVGASFIP
jgi:hypothetical protein